MAVKTILQLGDPRLREIALPLENPSAPEVAALVGDLADTLAYWRAATGYGRGIAAPQLGVRLRVVFLQLPGEKPWPLINPEILERSQGKIVVWDACLSFLSIFMQVERHREITVRYQDMNGEYHELTAGDDRSLSELLQHDRPSGWHPGRRPHHRPQDTLHARRIRKTSSPEQPVCRGSGYNRKLNDPQ
jgi:peptide deformylase